MKLSTKDALRILSLNETATIDKIKASYRRACSTYHPDRNPAGLEMMKIVNAAYDALRDYAPSATQEDLGSDINLGDDLNKALNAIINLGLTIEICGSWVWVSGDTKPHKETLKEAGYKWASKKLMWHYRPSDYKSHSRRKWSMDEIRQKHGSQTVKNRNFQRLSA